MIDFKFTHGMNEDAKKIREEVFVKEQGFAEEFDDIDAKAWHLVIYYDLVPIGTARLYPEDPETFHIGRVAVIKTYRHHKVGRTIMKFCETKIKTLGGRWALLLAQLDKKDFYRKCGYHESNDGEIVFDQGCPHVLMAKFLYKNRRGIRTKY